MALQIRQDYANQLMDQLPRYALELRRQDKQHEQFQAMQNLREAAEARNKTLFDMAYDRQTYASKVFKSQIEARAKLREDEVASEAYTTEHGELQDQYKDNYVPYLSPDTYKKHLERIDKYVPETVFGKKLSSFGLRDKEEYTKALKDLNTLKKDINPEDWVPKYIPPPDDLIIDPSLLHLVTGSMQPSRTSAINDALSALGLGGHLTSPMFSLQEDYSRSNVPSSQAQTQDRQGWADQYPINPFGR